MKVQLYNRCRVTTAVVICSGGLRFASLASFASRSFFDFKAARLALGWWVGWRRGGRAVPTGR